MPSFESKDQKILYGFLRLRINYTNENLIYKELEDCSFVRELHVYGTVVNHNSKDKEVQHMGFGRRLLKKAEEISFENNIHKVAIISGVGVREYYEKNGYELVHNYMIKKLYQYPQIDFFEIIFSLIILIFSISIIYDLIYEV